MLAIDRGKSTLAQSFEHGLPRAQPRLDLFAVRSGVQHHRKQKDILLVRVVKGLNALAQELRQRGDVVQFGGTFFGYAFVDLLIQQRFLFLRDANRVLPQARVHVLRGNYGSSLFVRNRWAFAHEWLVLHEDAGENCHERQQRPPGYIKLSFVVVRHGRSRSLHSAENRQSLGQRLSLCSAARFSCS